MYKTYFKQALYLIKESPFFSGISILGTAMAIALIMVIVIIYQIQTANYEPEVNRDRMLYITSVCLKEKDKDDGNFNYSNSSVSLVKDCFYPLVTPEAVAVASGLNETLATTTDATKRMKTDLRYTDAAFWKVFEFDFIDGRPFTGPDVTSGIPRAVITWQVARRLFGSTQVAGQEMLIGRRPYRIAGVVKDVTPVARDAYAQVWIPYAASELSEVKDEKTMDGFCGNYFVYLLARSSSDFGRIREEVSQSLKRFNSTLTELEVSIYSQPDELFVHNNRVWSSQDVNVKQLLVRYLIIFIVLLMVPALNLSGLTSSRMKKRMPELGVRKAFGATREGMVGQIVMENLLLTLFGGLLGIFFSYLGVMALKSWLFTTWNTYGLGTGIHLDLAALLSPAIFFYAFLFCLVLNLLSAVIPAWNAASHPIVDSLNDEY